MVTCLAGIMDIAKAEVIDPVMRHNYGVLLQPEGQLSATSEYWVHTFRFILPRMSKPHWIPSTQCEPKGCTILQEAIRQANRFTDEVYQEVRKLNRQIELLLPEHRVLL